MHDNSLDDESDSNGAAANVQSKTSSVTPAKRPREPESEAVPSGTRRKLAHVSYEQKRRGLINTGFATLRAALPNTLRPRNESKAALLQTAVEYIQLLEAKVATFESAEGGRREQLGRHDAYPESVPPAEGLLPPAPTSHVHQPLPSLNGLAYSGPSAATHQTPRASTAEALVVESRTPPPQSPTPQPPPPANGLVHSAPTDETLASVPDTHATEPQAPPAFLSRPGRTVASLLN